MLLLLNQRTLIRHQLALPLSGTAQVINIFTIGAPRGSRSDIGIASTPSLMMVRHRALLLGYGKLVRKDKIECYNNNMKNWMTKRNVFIGAISGLAISILLNYMRAFGISYSVYKIIVEPLFFVSSSLLIVALFLLSREESIEFCS